MGFGLKIKIKSMQEELYFLYELTNSYAGDNHM